VEDRPARSAPAVLSTAKPFGPSGYRPHLDGLRSIAVYLVVAYHAGIARFSDGFIGVDVFFVLSGYLVTQLLVRDIRGEGRVRFARFYSRRFRRLLPAALVTLVVSAVVFTAISTPAEVAGAMGGVRAAFLYVTNWYFIHQSADYFAADINTNPVLHFWSLAVEEQFYFVWPLLLSVLFLVGARFGRHKWMFVRIAVVAGAIVSMLAALRIEHTNLSRAYYGTDTRAYQLLAGAFLALTPVCFDYARRFPKLMRVAGVASVVAIFLLASSLFERTPVERGIAVAVVVCTLLLAIESGVPSITARALSLSPLVYLGRVSYGTYLWHWIVILVAAHAFDPSPISMFAIACLVATGIASLSYQVLERPIRESNVLDRHRRVVVAVGVSLSLVFGVFAAPRLLDSDKVRTEVATAPAAATGPTDVSAAAPALANLDWKAALDDKPAFPNCLGKSPRGCVVVEGHGPRVMLMGDSVARMLLPAFQLIAQKEGFELDAAVRPNCPWQRGVLYEVETVNCPKYQKDWYERLVPQLDPDVIVVSHRPIDDPNGPQTMIGPDGRFSPMEAEGTRELDDATRKSLQGLHANGRKVVIVESVPLARTKDDPLKCISQATTLDACRFVADAQSTPLEEIDRDIAKHTDATWSLDLDHLLCPYMPICDPVVAGQIVRRDVVHITGSFARGLAPAIEQYLKDNRIL
jgi:peptidoglycan/LPS O-acetylase OafA/YrhL